MIPFYYLTNKLFIFTHDIIEITTKFMSQKPTGHIQGKGVHLMTKRRVEMVILWIGMREIDIGLYNILHLPSL